MKTYPIETEEKLRECFWDENPELAQRAESRLHKDPRNVRQNEHRAEARVRWVEYVDHMARCGDISEELAKIVTL